METTRLSSKGQVILPKAIRDHYHWSTGTELEIETRPDGVVLRPRKPLASTSHDEVVGCTGYRGPAKSLDDMQDAIARGVRERHAGG